MAKIGLVDTYSVIPEGTYVFKITGTDYKEEYGKLEVTMQLASGRKHVEKFSLLKDNGKPNEGAMNAFSYFAKTALNDFTVTEIEPEDLIGHYIRCEVYHDEVPSTRTPGKILTFVHLGDKSSADGFDEPVESDSTVGRKTTTPTANESQKAAQTKTEAFDLNSLLG